MVKAVKGYQTFDGSFFDTIEAANYHETKVHLINIGRKAIQVTQQNIPAFMDFLEEYPNEVSAFCAAYKALPAKVVETVDPSIAEMSKGETFDAPDKKPTKT